MGAYRRRSMPVPAQGGLPLEFTLLPHKLILRIQNDKVVDVGGRDEVLFASGSGVYAPAAEEDDVGAADVGGVAVTG